MQDLIIDNEFKKLMQPLSAEEYSQLEENILRDGIQETLKVWQGILIDGHNRYEIAKKYGLNFEVSTMQFENRNAVTEWIIKNQFGRRNLSAYDRSMLALKLKLAIAAKAKANSFANLKQNMNTECEKFCTRIADKLNQEKIPVIVDSFTGEELEIDCSDHLALSNTQKKSREKRTDAQIAKLAGVSEDTIRKVEKIEESATSEIKAAVKNGEISINAAYKGVKTGAETVSEIFEFQQKSKKPFIVHNSDNNEMYTPKEYIDAAREVMGSIDLDPASSASANEVVQAEKIYTVEDDGLTQNWYGNIWLNPPYSKDLLPKFADKFSESEFNQAIVFVHNATETKWFLKFVSRASAIVFLTGSVNCKTPRKNTCQSLQGEAFIYSGENKEKFVEVFQKFGWKAWL